jgi:hypothetical protein
MQFDMNSYWVSLAYHFEHYYLLYVLGGICSCYVSECLGRSAAVFLYLLSRQLSLCDFELFDRVHVLSSVEQQQEPVYILHMIYHFPWHHPQRRFAHEQLDKQLPFPSVILPEKPLTASEASNLKGMVNWLPFFSSKPTSFLCQKYADIHANKICQVPIYNQKNFGRKVEFMFCIPVASFRCELLTEVSSWTSNFQGFWKSA